MVEVPLHTLIASKLSGKNLHGVPIRELNPGLPYSKPTYCQLSYAAILTALHHTQSPNFKFLEPPCIGSTELISCEKSIPSWS
jgi:hypothetical protein